MEEEEAEVKRKATDAAYQGKLNLVTVEQLTMQYCTLMKIEDSFVTESTNSNLLAYFSLSSSLLPE